MKTYRYPSALTIAGFDGSGGAGIQADIKTFSALGIYATSVLTALPVQNTTGVREIYPIPPEVVGAQIEAVLDDVFPAAIKIGMVHSPEIVEIIALTLKKYPAIPIIFDPVMVATSGQNLLKRETLASIEKYILPLAEIITPNMDEAKVMSGLEVNQLQDMLEAGFFMRSQGCKSVLVKGGHQQTARISSVFIDASGKQHIFESDRIETKNTHGSGCTLSSAIAAYLAQEKTVLEAVRLAQLYVASAIEAGKDVQTGKGNGPLNHFFNPMPTLKF